MFPLPLSYRSRIASVDGVEAVSIGNWFGGTYQDKKNFFPKFGVDATSYFPMYPEYGVPPDQFASFLRDRKGCIVGRKLAERFGFKVGDTIPVIGDIYAGDWEFNVRGIYEGKKKGTDETIMFLHWKYIDESLPKRFQGQVGFYIVQLGDPAAAGRISKLLDAQFENATEQTLTETEKAFQTEFVRMMGNIGLLVRAIGGAVVFAILLVAGNTMAMTARERTTEIAVLKTIGFRGGILGCLVVAEGLLLTLAGWALGVGLSWAICDAVGKAYANFFPVFSLAADTAALGLGVAILTGVVASLFPAAHAFRTSIVGAMREVS
jgi:putative ABC transport system permease protein